MAITLNSGSSTINGTVNITSGLPVPTTGKTVVYYTGTGNAGVQTAYTVAAGYKFHLCGVNCGQFGQAVTSVICYVFDNDGATFIQDNGFQCTSGGNSSQQKISGTVPFWTYTAGQAVKIQTTNGTHWQVWGILEAV